MPAEPTLDSLIRTNLEAKPRETFLFAQTEERRYLRDLVQRAATLSPDDYEKLTLLSGHDDFVVGESALEILRTSGDADRIGNHLKALTVLSDFPDSWRRQSLALLTQKLDDTALPLVDTLLTDQDAWVRRTATAALRNKSFDAAYPRLVQMWDTHTDEESRRMVVTTMGRRDEPEAEAFLLKVARSDMGTKAGDEARMYLLKKELGRASDPVAAVLDRVTPTMGDLDLFQLSLAIEHMEEQSDAIMNGLIEELREHELPKIRRLVDFLKVNRDLNGWPTEPPEDGDRRIPLDSDRSRLLWNQKPLFASEQTNDTIALLNDVNTISRELRDAFGSDFIGFIMYGSTGEGYRLPDSDFDAAVVVKKGRHAQEITKRVNRFFETRKKRDPFSVTIPVDDSMHSVNEKLTAYLFQGAFIGNKGELDIIQRETLAALTPEQWDDVRREIKGMLAGPHTLGKLRERQNLQDADPFIMEQWRTLLRVPPDYDSMRKILDKRTVNSRADVPTA